ncbi:MAG TPA: hypothetical protein VLS27_14900 [Gammaproteobacteria bacterium]|nr:hypothetical protein [Gammaproteobacteria bacterium]
MVSKTDDPIDRTRRARHEISARFGDDPRRLVEHYMELQKRHGDRLIEHPAPYPLERRNVSLD